MPPQVRCRLPVTAVPSSSSRPQALKRCLSLPRRCLLAPLSVGVQVRCPGLVSIPPPNSGELYRPTQSILSTTSTLFTFTLPRAAEPTNLRLSCSRCVFFTLAPPSQRVIVRRSLRPLTLEPQLPPTDRFSHLLGRPHQTPPKVEIVSAPPVTNRHRPLAFRPSIRPFLHCSHA